MMKIWIGPHIMRWKTLALFGLLFVGGSIRVAAQDLDCSLIAQQRNARAEGKAELLGDILIQCVAADPGLVAPPWETQQVNIIVNLPVNVTNNVDFGQGGSTTDASVIVNDVAQGYGVLTANKEIAFDGVTVPFPGFNGNPDTTVIRISSIRGNVGQFPLPAPGNAIQIDAIVSTEPPSTLSIGVPIVALAFSRLGLISEGVGAVGGVQCVSSDESSVSSMTIREGFSSSWKVQGIPSAAIDTSWESGYYAPGSNNDAGASGPTMFRVAFSDVPDGVTLSLPTTIDNGNGLVLTLDGASCATAGTESIALDANGAGEAIYAVCSTDSQTLEQVEIPVTTSWEADEVEAGVGQVAVDFYPLGGSDFASVDDPEPRFTNTGTPKSLLDIEPCTLSSDLAITIFDKQGAYQDIYFVPADLGPFVRLTASPYTDRDPEWSPKGDKLLYNGNTAIRVVDASGANDFQLTQNPVSSAFGRWSPDGSKIAFNGFDPDFEIYTANANGASQMKLTDNSASDQLLGWSSDGSKILFISNRDGNFEVYVMNADGSGQTNLTHNGGQDYFPQFSPDGSKIAFTSSRAGAEQLFVMNADGSGVLRLTYLPGTVYSPSWSPDGQKIAFAVVQASGQEIYTISPDGTGLEPFTSSSGNESIPLWSPDGSEIAYRYAVANETYLYVKRVADGDPKLVSEISSSSLFSWRPIPRVAKTPGVYREGEWMLDVNGDGSYSMADDKRFFFGFEGATPFVGDWNGDGHDEVGVYAGGFWFLDYDGDGLYDGLIDKVFPYGWDDPSVKPITGDWNGDGATDVGLYVNGIWFLDSNGSRTFDGADKIFGLGGWDGSVPFVGDWDGDGKDSAGIYSFGFWFLDNDGDGVFDTNTGDKLYPFGWNDPLVQPQVGDWNGDGKTDVGVYAAGTWFADSDGDELFTGADKVMALGWNNPALVPVVGDWNGDGRETPGVVDGGVWYLEKNGDWFYDGNDSIVYWGDDWPGNLREFLPGRW